MTVIKKTHFHFIILWCELVSLPMESPTEGVYFILHHCVTEFFRQNFKRFPCARSIFTELLMVLLQETSGSVWEAITSQEERSVSQLPWDKEQEIEEIWISVCVCVCVCTLMPVSIPVIGQRTRHPGKICWHKAQSLSGYILVIHKSEGFSICSWNTIAHF